MRISILLSLITFCLAIRGYAQEDVVPPPLAYSNWDTDEQEYRVVDFASGEVTTIPRTGGISRGEFGGEQFMPDERTLVSPYDESVQILFTNDSGRGVEDVGGYTVYRILASGEREYINEIGLTSTPLDWSPNGRYFYFLGDRHENAFTLYQYDLESRQLTPMLESPRGIEANCYQDTEWCGLRHHTSPDSFDELSLYVLNTNTGELQFVASTPSSSQWIWWQNDSPAFIYLSSIGEERQSLRLYNYQDDTDTLIAETDAYRISNLAWSPEHRWLTFTGLVDQQHELFAIDFQSASLTVELLTGEYDFTVRSQFYQWRTAEKLFFDVAYSDDSTRGFYVADFASGEILIAGEFSTTGSLMDWAWSPDGRWLAVSYGAYGDSNNLYVVDSFAEVPSLEVPIAYEAPFVICLGWYTLEILFSGEANLCDDVYMGIG